MLHILLMLLLGSCCKDHGFQKPHFIFEKSQIPLAVKKVVFSVDPCTEGATIEEEDRIMLAHYLRQWSKSRFKTVGSSGVLMINVKLVALSAQNHGKVKNALSNHAVQIKAFVQESDLYSDLDIDIQAHRSLNTSPKSPKVGTSEWAEYLKNFIDTIDTQFMYALRRYGPKLLPAKLQEKNEKK